MYVVTYVRVYVVTALHYNQYCTDCYILGVYRYPINFYSRQPIFQADTDY